MFTTSCDLNYSFLFHSYLALEYIFFYSQIALPSFLHFLPSTLNISAILSKALFFCIYWSDHMAFIVNLLIQWITIMSFQMLNQYWLPGTNSLDHETLSIYHYYMTPFVPGNILCFNSWFLILLSLLQISFHQCWKGIFFSLTYKLFLFIFKVGFL